MVSHLCAEVILAIFVVMLAAFGSTSAQIDDFLTIHNAARQAVAVSNLTWDPIVADYAINFTNLQRDNNSCASMAHSHGPYGENVFWGSPGKLWSSADAVNSWVSAKQYFDPTSNTCAQGHQCGEYTQVVWRNTANLGCASVVCNDNSTLIMCNYNPPGNIVGQRPF